MTIVIAQIRDQEILLKADRKVNDVNAARSDTIPGCLKIVTVRPYGKHRRVAEIHSIGRLEETGL